MHVRKYMYIAATASAGVAVERREDSYGIAWMCCLKSTRDAK
jgi:hypothetical protein